MIFGNKDFFAIEVEVNNVFHDEFIGEGKFIIYINNKSYGVHSPYATMFFCIMEQICYFINNKVNVNNIFKDYSYKDISKCYYNQNYSDIILNEYSKEFLKQTKQLITWAPEAAFDDGSYLIQIDDDELTRLIAFKSYSNGSICSVEEGTETEIILDRHEYIKILQSVYNYLKNIK